MNKNTLFLIISILFFSSIAYSQLTSPHFISVNFGTSLPVGDFKEVDSIASSGANTGLYYSFEAGAYFSKFFGIALNVGAFSNAVDKESIKDQIKRDFNPNGQYTVSSDKWVNGYIMLGPILSFGNDKIILDLKVLGGLMNTAKPFINVQSTTGNTTTTINQSNEVTSSAIGLNYGLHLRFKLVGKLGLRINAEGFMSNQEFDTKVEETDVNGGAPVITSQKLEKQIRALNLGAGLILTL